MAFRVEVQTDQTGQWYENELTFATEQEAKQYADALAVRWLAVRDFRIVQTD